MSTRSFLRGFCKAIRTTVERSDFDPVFYLSHYDDLKFIKDHKKALKHYLSDGKREGRFASAPEYEAHMASISETLSVDFDEVAYKFFNRDLQHRFKTRNEFLRHYVEHGHKEGRRYSFDDSGRLPSKVSPPSHERWQAVFSVAEFAQAIPMEAGRKPLTRTEALELFVSEGIDKLWPISLDYQFEPHFYRAEYSSPGCQLSASQLYKHWLDEGFASGESPNERHFLSAYLGDRSYPEHFDWKQYIKLAGLPRNTSRSHALIHLFGHVKKMLPKHQLLLGADKTWLLPLIGRYALQQGNAGDALNISKLATEISGSAEAFTLLGDALRQVGKPQRALDAYLRAQSYCDVTLEAYLNAAQIAVMLHDYQQAFEILRSGSALMMQSHEFTKFWFTAVTSYFEHTSALAHGLYLDGSVAGRSKADAIINELLFEITKVIREFDQLPPRVGPAPNGHIAIIANDDLPQCTHYRIKQKLQQLNSIGITTHVVSHREPQGFIDAIVGSRAVIFYRVAATPDIIRAILHTKAMEITTYYEIDDLIFDSQHYPDPLDTFEGQISAEQYAGLTYGVPLFRYAMSMCDKGIASTDALANEMRHVIDSKNVILIPNGLDDENISPAFNKSFSRQHKLSKVRMIYGSGTKAHNLDFNEDLAPALAIVLSQNPNAELVIVGHLKLSRLLDPFKARIVQIPFISDVREYWAILSTCHINISVLHLSKFSDCKSEIKWIEAAALRIPSVVSSTSTYLSCITDNVDGFVAKTMDDWVRILGLLIRSDNLRIEVGNAAYTKVHDSYSLNSNARILEREFTPVHECARFRKKLRVLVCNVFFAPQSIGGATRVVEGNVKHFLDNFDDLEVGVFCSQMGGDDTGKIAISGFGEAPVYRFSACGGPNQDRRATNKESAVAFERVIDAFRPDVIHFHAIQRLSASIVEVAAKRRIPHAITTHDAWWISDYQFLVNSDGVIEMPTEDFFEDAKASVDIAESVARRRFLQAALDNATRAITVSAAFAEIYRGAGVEKIEVIENGLPEILPLPLRKREDGRVGLGHIGGRSAHKGAFWIEAVLRGGNFRNLHLTMIDGALAPGRSVETVWGTTPVTLLGPCPQNGIERLYAQFSVLLAPSMWPESYGLVTREALACGLWVVATDLGALADDIKPGENGLIVNAYDKSFEEALAYIDSRPETFSNRLATDCSTIRSSAAQANDLREIYFAMAAAPSETDIKTH